MRITRLKAMCAALGLSIALSGCLKIEGTTTVLEDGRIIDYIVLQPKHSLLTSLALASDAFPLAMETVRRKSLDRVREQLHAASDACKIADFLFNKQAYAEQGIPYSTVPTPMEFEFSGTMGNGCSINIGPYDPRTLPEDFTKDVLGMRVVSSTGRYDPYQLSIVKVVETLDEMVANTHTDVPKLEASCAAEVKPELCQEELEIAMNFIRNLAKEGGIPDELREMVSNPGMLLGMGEMNRMVLKSVLVTTRIPSNAAVHTARGAGDFTYGQGWLWRGSLMELMTSASEFSLEVRPTRPVTPGASSH